MLKSQLYQVDVEVMRHGLSSEEFAVVLDGVSGQAATAREKRRAERLTRRFMVTLTLDKGTPAESSVDVVVRDVSARGVCVLHRGDLPRGTQFVMHLRGGKEENANILCSVAHCRQVEKTLYAIGAEFTCLLRDPPPGKSSDEASREQARIMQAVMG